MRRGVRVAILCACVVLVAAPGRRASAGDDDGPPPGSIPLPLVGRLTVKPQGKTYTIDGPQVIPKGSEIHVQGSVRIVGVRKASLDVQGGLSVHGTQDNWVSIENVDFGPTRAPVGDLRFDMADFWGCSFVSSETTAYEGGLTIENSCLQRTCKFDLALRSGFLRVMTTEFRMPCRVTCVATKGREPEVSIRTSWMKAVSLTGPSSATLRGAQIKEGLEARDFTSLQVDGCDVSSGLTFQQGPEGSFSKLVLTKCNLLGGAKLKFVRPVGDKIPMERVKVERFFFGDASNVPALAEKQVRERIEDGTLDPQVSVKTIWSKPEDRRHFFLDSSLRTRAPPAR